MSEYESIIDSLTEEDAYALANDLYTKWGWCGEWFTRQDVALVWDDLWAERNVGDPPPFDDTTWDAIRSSEAWRTQIRQRMGRDGWKEILDLIQKIQRDSAR